MRAIVFNNTSRFHAGCAAVMRTLHRAVTDAGCEITESVYGNTMKFDKVLPTWSPANFEAADVIVVNGEGTMHDDSRMSRFLMDQVIARRGHRKVALVNSLWQNMDPADQSTLGALDLVCAREPASALAMNVPGVIVMPDLSFYDRPPVSTLPAGGMALGTFYRKAHADLTLDTSVNIARQDWSTIVNTLRASTALFTGKHHEVYAACVARCPFVTSNISTHKVAALGQLIGHELPTVPPTATENEVRAALTRAAEDTDGLFAALFDTLEAAARKHDLAALIRGIV